MKLFLFPIDIQEDGLLVHVKMAQLLQHSGRLGLQHTQQHLLDSHVVLTQPSLIFKPANTPHRLVFELVIKALLRACSEQLRAPLSSLNTAYAQGILKQVGQWKQSALAISYTPQILTDRTQWSFLPPFFKYYQYWLKQHLGCTPTQSQGLCRSFPLLFGRALVVEWYAQPQHYAPLHHLFDAAYWKKKHAQIVYESRLNNLVFKPVLGETKLPLHYIYIKPSFMIYEEGQKAASVQKDGFVKAQPSLLDYLIQKIVHQKDQLGHQQKRLVFLLGQPGQGKTSFCYQLMHHLLQEPDFNQNLYFVKFRNIPNNWVKDLIEKPFEIIARYLKEEQDLEVNWSPFNYEPLVLVLDGLDELYMSQGLTTDDLKKLYTILLEKLRNRPQWHIVLTSRYNYLQVRALQSQCTVVLKLASLSLEQQEIWLGRYLAKDLNTTLTIERLRHIHKQVPHIKELIEQPILLHFIALANLDLSQKANRSTLYQQLFAVLLDRNWDEQKQLPKFQTLQQADYKPLFRHWIQTIAFEIYKGNGTYITREAMLDLPITKDIKTLIHTHEEQQEALKDLLVAFYFQNVRNRNASRSEPLAVRPHAIEFLHQSLQEYLTIEYILRDLKKKLLDDNGHPKLNLPPKSILGFFHGWFAQKGLSVELCELLVEQVAQLPPLHRSAIRNILKENLDYCLRHQFLFKYTVKQPTPPIQQMAHTFEAYWNILVRADPKQNATLFHVNSKQQVFCTLLKLPYRYKNLFLCDLVLNEADLNHANLEGANLEHIKLRKAQLNRVNLSSAQLKKAYLREADLSEANLKEANLEAADLIKANLTQADLSEAKLIDTDLEEALLNKAILSKTDLSRANLLQAQLSVAILRMADLSGAILREAKLDYANLSATNLSGANLREADLRETDLRESDLKKADLRQADLGGANLSQADLSESDLSGADLDQTDFTGADLSGADLSEANFKATNLTQTKLDQAKTKSLDFFDHLRKEQCIGITVLESRYVVDSKSYSYWEKDKISPFYLIIKRF